MSAQSAENSHCHTHGAPETSGPTSGSQTYSQSEASSFVTSFPVTYYRMLHGVTEGKWVIEMAKALGFESRFRIR